MALTISMMFSLAKELCRRARCSAPLEPIQQQGKAPGEREEDDGNDYNDGVHVARVSLYPAESK
jgi:hypothetical protein